MRESEDYGTLLYDIDVKNHKFKKWTGGWLPGITSRSFNETPATQTVGGVTQAVPTSQGIRHSNGHLCQAMSTATHHAHVMTNFFVSSQLLTKTLFAQTFWICLNSLRSH